jgi:hypothetical protein
MKQNCGPQNAVTDSSAESIVKPERATMQQQPSDERVLRDKASEAIRAGRIPQRRPQGVWGGPGTGAACDICGTPVTREGLGFELDFGPKAADSPAELYVTHIRCFAAWELECQPTLQAAGENGRILSCERHLRKQGGSD